VRRTQQGVAQKGDNMNNKLKVEFFGDVKFECGKLQNPIKIEDFEKRFKVSLVQGSECSNEYGTEDATYENEEISIKAECSNGFVTHINDFEEK
jgi:hypothetical protein